MTASVTVLPYGEREHFRSSTVSRAMEILLHDAVRKWIQYVSTRCKHSVVLDHWNRTVKVYNFGLPIASSMASSREFCTKCEEPSLVILIFSTPFVFIIVAVGSVLMIATSKPFRENMSTFGFPGEWSPCLPCTASWTSRHVLIHVITYDDCNDYRRTNVEEQTSNATLKLKVTC